MFNSPICNIILSVVIILAARKIIQDRKEDKIFREYMAKMAEMRKLKNKIEANRSTENISQPKNSKTQNTDIHYYENGFDKGEAGEWAIEYALKRTLPSNIYILRNLYIPYRDIKSEVDLILLHETGIYVFESKNYSGWIFGNKNSKNWTQCLNGEKNKFYNPIFQNRTHINAIVKQLKLPLSQRPKSYIVFGEHCELKAVPKSDENIVICRQQELIPIIEKRIEEAPQIYNREVLKYMNSHLQQFEKY